MNHLSESELTLHYYGDAEDAAAADRHLAECEACRQEFRRIQAVLSSVEMPVPEPAADYEARLWRQISPQIPPRGIRSIEGSRVVSPLRSWLVWQRWAVVGAAAALIFAAFFLGRLSERAVPGSPGTPGGPLQASGDVATIKHRVLLVALESHLDRTQLLLTELANADPAQSMDLSDEEAAARALLDDNRLYRQTAAQVHDQALVQVLDELERLLVDLSHRPGTVSLAEWREIQQRIQSQGILFKVRVMGSQVREQERAMRDSATGKIKT